jgi:4-amino-4-deoxy-L-arabinose transferase-like glycosyltransferase
VWPRTISLNDRTHFLLLCLFSFLILFVPLRRGDLSGYDDAVYAGQAKAMIHSGDWWNVRFNGALDFEKPPLFLWMEALSLSLLGFSDFAAKVPAALAGFGTIVLVYFLAKELTDDPWLSRLAMVVLLSTQYFMKYATHAMTDAPFAFFFTLTIFLYVKGLRAPRYFVLAGLPAACALLTRSVLGMIPIGIILLHLAVTRRYGILFSRRCLWFLVLALSLPGIWVAIEYRLYGVEFLRAHAAFVLGQVQAEKPGSAWSGLAQLLEYPKLIAQRYWPWLPFMLVGLYKQSRAALSQRDSAATLLVLWVLCVVACFSLAEVKYLRYILPVFPAFAILSASVLNDWIPLRRKIQSFQALYALGAVFVVYAALFPMTLLRATDMRQLAPVADAHTTPQEGLLIYSSGAQDWGVQNQLLWYGNRHTELITDLSDVQSRLESGRNSVVVIDKEAAGRLRAALAGGKTERITVLAQSEKFSCLKYSPPPV